MQVQVQVIESHSLFCLDNVHCSFRFDYMWVGSEGGNRCAILESLMYNKCKSQITETLNSQSHTQNKNKNKTLGGITPQNLNI